MRSKIDISELLNVSFLGVRIPIGARYFSLSKMSRPTLGPTQPSIQGVPVFFSGVKWTGLEVSHCSPSIVEVKIEWSYTSSPPMCVCGLDMANFSFSFPSLCTGNESGEYAHISSCLSVRMSELENHHKFVIN